MRILKKLGRAILYLTYLLVFISVVVYAFFYRPYIKELRQHKRGTMALSSDPHATRLPAIRHVDPEVMKLLGKARGNKSSSFSEFNKAKGPGVFRVCCLGDSFTAGDEVDDLYDYPSILQELFHEAGFSHVEVLNFGIGGYGFAQVYMMWDRVARNFSCDTYLLGPRGFQSIRDTTFGHILDWSPYHVHARYILSGDDIELVEVPGETYGERFDHQFRFLTPWRYLRYNRNPPAFLESVIPRGRTIKNPFYYDRRPLDEEAHDIYQALFARMAREETPIIAGPHRRAIVDVADRVPHGRLSVSRFHDRLTVPYLAKYSHASPMGNQLVARQFFLQLTGQEGPLWTLETADLEWQSAGGGEREAKRQIESLARIELEVAGTPMAQLIVHNTSLATLKTDSLLSLSGLDETMVDGCFAPLDFELQAGMEVVMKVGQEEHLLGKVSLLGGGLNIGVIKADGFLFWRFRDFERLDQLSEPTPLTHGKRKARGLFFKGTDQIVIEGRDRATLLVHGRPAFVGEGGEIDAAGGLWFEPVKGPCRVFRGFRTGLLEFDALPPSGLVHLVAEHWQDGVIRRPVATWQKTEVELSQPRNPPKQLSFSGSTPFRSLSDPRLAQAPNR